MTNHISVVFPGQGSQSVGMLNHWIDQNNLFRDYFTEASDILGYDLVDLVTHDKDGLLNQTEYTQPAIYTTSAAIWYAFNECFDLSFSCMSGHSLGEYTALMAAGALSFADGLTLVQKRAKAMQSASPEGLAGMSVVIGLDNESVDAICTEIELSDLTIGPANYNAPGQVVVAGVIEAIERFEVMAKSQGAKLVKRLPMSVPSHSPLMLQATEELSSTLDTVKIQMPSTPVYSNVTGRPHGSPQEIKLKLKEQLIAPVLWVNTLKNQQPDGVTHQLEIGPGKVLTGLAKRSIPQWQLFSITHPSEISQVCEQLQS